MKPKNYVNSKHNFDGWKISATKDVNRNTRFYSDDEMTRRKGNFFEQTIQAVY